MLYDSADDARERYEYLASGAAALRAQDITLGASIAPAPFCPNPSCLPFGERHRAVRVESTTSETGYRCARCKLAWPIVEVGSLGVSVRGSPEGIAKRMHGQQAERCTLALVLFDRPARVGADRWSAMHWAWALALYGRSDRNHVTQAFDAFRRAGVATGETAIAGMVRTVREEVTARLERRGLLAQGG